MKENRLIFAQIALKLDHNSDKMFVIVHSVVVASPQILWLYYNCIPFNVSY